MHFTQYYLDCLSQASYLIADTTTGQAIVVDPRRDVGEYLADAHAANLTIVGVINTHFHADFVSGHLELAQATGAWIGFGDAATTEFTSRALHDGERISLGDVTLEIMTTPGHTPESISVLVYEHAHDNQAYGILTGDALFIGDVGRPDLLASVGYTQEELGKQLYHSIHHKIMNLPDDVRVFPAHGAGSACGKNLSTEKQSTIGEQRRTNYACQPMTEADFLAVVTAGQPSAPDYFVYNATINRQTREVLNTNHHTTALTTEDTLAELRHNATVLDTRDATTFATGHLNGSINVSVDGRTAETIGMVIDPHARIVIGADDDAAAQETAVRLARIGFDNIAGYIPHITQFFIDHAHLVSPASRLTPHHFATARTQGTIQILDVRNLGELASGAVEGSTHIPLAELKHRLNELHPTTPTVVYCAGGWRSSVAASYLRANGFTDVSDVLGGYTAINPASVCPSTLTTN